MMERRKAYQAQTIQLKALAHPARIQILEVLAHEEACVCHLTALLGLRQPYVSQQLMTLREAGLVRDRRDGLMIYYRLADPRVSDLLQLSRQIVMARTGDRFPEPPSGPVADCPCPACTAAAGSGESAAVREAYAP
jgi:DNA-binding transcriptional ArsR family regulator